MGQVHADIELINGEDLSDARRGYIDKDEVKRVWVRFLVDTGATMLAINEYIQEQLKFPVSGQQRAVLADGNVVMCDIASYIELRFGNQKTLCTALVLPGDSEPLLGLKPLDELNVVIDPKRNRLVPNAEHPNMPLAKLGKLVVLSEG